MTSEPDDAAQPQEGGLPPSGFRAEQGLPPVVYVPSQEMEPGENELNLELRYLTDGHVAVLAYTSLDRLVSACGTAQPWALLHSEQIWQLRDSGTVDVVAVDPEIPAGLRRDGTEGQSVSEGSPADGGDLRGDGPAARTSQQDRWPTTPPGDPPMER